MKIRLLDAAKEDLRSAYRFYEAQSPGLGNYFLDSIRADVRSLGVFAGIHSTAEGFFRMLAKRFPFALYYLVAEDRVDIYAVLDCRRDPTWIAARLASETGESAGAPREDAP